MLTVLRLQQDISQYHGHCILSYNSVITIFCYIALFMKETYHEADSKFVYLELIGTTLVLAGGVTGFTAVTIRTVSGHPGGYSTLLSLSYAYEAQLAEV